MHIYMYFHRVGVMLSLFILPILFLQFDDFFFIPLAKMILIRHGDDIWILCNTVEMMLGS